MRHIRNQLKEIDDDYESITNIDIDEDIQFRKEQNGIMPICKNCTKDCKVPFAFGITNFTCFTYLPRS